MSKPSDERSNIGRILVDIGACDAEDVASAVAEQNNGKRLGEMMVARGLITEDELARALELQEQMRSGRSVEAMLKIVDGATMMTKRALIARVA